jgi:hypothetical protein
VVGSIRNGAEGMEGPVENKLKEMKGKEVMVSEEKGDFRDGLTGGWVYKEQGSGLKGENG